MQEWVVDAWATIEQKRLSWLRNNQQTLRADSYSSFEDAVAEGLPLRQIGVRTVLPSSHLGSPRYMSQSYHDCMAIVTSRGKPSLFITMTTNSRWPEILEQLDAGETTSDRPDIVARVFHLKLEAVLKEIFQDMIFGQVLGGTYVVEYQKRGLPHAHILVILHPRARPVSPAHIDKIVSAKLPNRETHPNLWRTVTGSLLHKACGRLNPRAPCMKDGACKSRYPKPFIPFTIIREDGYPDYGRPDDGVTYVDRDFVYDNRHVVPYNPYLTAKYDCHINCEIASHITAVKYLFKYIYKGHDRSAFTIHEGEINLDEIQRYLDARYVSAAEACYRIFEFKITERWPAVTRLPLHLEGQHFVSFREDDDPEEVLDKQKMSALEAFFHFCLMNPAVGRNLSYSKAPEHLTWNKSSATWSVRCASPAVGRVAWAPPNSGEVRYCEG